MVWKIFSIVGIIGMLFGVNLIVREMASSYPPFIEPGTTYWQAKFPTLIPGIVLLIVSSFAFMLGSIYAIKNRRKIGR